MRQRQLQENDGKIIHYRHIYIKLYIKLYI